MGSAASLWVYNWAAARRWPAAADPAGWPVRPAGQLVWLCGVDAGRVAAITGLVRAFRNGRPGASFLCTPPSANLSDDLALPPRCWVVAPPADTPLQVGAFLDHWRPDLAVFLPERLPPAAIASAARCGVPVALIDARPPLGLPRPARRLPGLRRAVLRLFDRVLAQDDAAARSLRRLGAPSARLSVVGTLADTPPVLPCNEAERDALGHTLAARLLWLAVAVPAEEEAAMIAAHRAALGLSHRLLMIWVPADPASGPDLAARLLAEGFEVSLRSREEEPDEEDQIYIADTEDELGLWYRLASVSYLGGTLSGAASPRHPFEPASLGSAILHGPLGGPHGPALARLDAARAARLVRSPADLCDAIGDLRAPDRAAQMAHDAWAVASDGADVAERTARHLIEVLDAAPRPEQA
jgi:3-deoxy-D-manno-octulosonic-acid transferase